LQSSVRAKFLRPTLQKPPESLIGTRRRKILHVGLAASNPLIGLISKLEKIPWLTVRSPVKTPEKMAASFKSKVLGED
jgi:hypothetical protein